MKTTNPKNGELSKVTASRSNRPEVFIDELCSTRSRFSFLKNAKWLMMLMMATLLWQCDKDDYTGETTGICPLVIYTDPMDGEVNVVTSKILSATFNEKMDSSTINSTTFLLKQGSQLLSGSVSYSDSTATFTPATALADNTVYTGVITTGARDLEGNALVKDTTWTFTTAAAIVIPQFTVSVTSSPIAGGLTSGGGTFASGTTVTVLAATNAGYTFTNWTEGLVEVSTNAGYSFTILANRILKANFTAIPPVVADAINLGSAANFAILSGSGVSNTGITTRILGDVGSFPTATMNGLLSNNVNGILYTSASPVVGVAKDDLTAAYIEAQGKSLNAISLPGQLGGLTLAPGLYVNSSTSGISGTGANGILTLDAGGNPNAVWIFKMGSTLVTDAGTSIVLAGGAKTKNIYWSVGSSATLGTNSVFYGNILADQSISLTTGATLYGRALTRIGAITLDSNLVIKPQ